LNEQLLGKSWTITEGDHEKFKHTNALFTEIAVNVSYNDSKAVKIGGT